MDHVVVMTEVGEVSVMVSRDNALISGHPGGLTPGNPRAFTPRHL